MVTLRGFSNMFTEQLFLTDWRDLWGDTLLDTAPGSVYTKSEIVELILDLAGYDPQRSSLIDHPLLEPSCGDGAFVSAIVRRLILSIIRTEGSVNWDHAKLESAIRAVDIDSGAVDNARSLIVETLIEAGCNERRANSLATCWASQGDFLLSHDADRFDFVVGNPPYVRLEDVPKSVLAEYRKRYSTLTDRADIYIAFFERGLRMLTSNGVLAFICANRFAKNQYGVELRKEISRSFHLRHYINLEHTQPFEKKVSAYPAIIVLDKQRGNPTLAGTLNELSEATLDNIRRQTSGLPVKSKVLEVFKTWYPDGAPWISTARKSMSYLEDLRRYPVLEQSGETTTIGIGVATGADDIFIRYGKDDAVEADRQLPLILASDITPEALRWSGRYLLNPYANGEALRLVTKHDSPGLLAYFHKHELRLKARHTARNNPAQWYKTIDRVYPLLMNREKLVIPDIQSGGVVGYDSGDYYPHHNVYWITSKEWDLRVLQAILRSSYVTAQISAYSVQMRGGSLRYQAQSLRKIRIPKANSIDATLRKAMAEVASSRDITQIDVLAEHAFGISRKHIP